MPHVDEVVMEGQGMATKKLGPELEAVVSRLDKRINRSRDHHESMINTMRNEPMKFQAEMWSTITGFIGYLFKSLRNWRAV